MAEFRIDPDELVETQARAIGENAKQLVKYEAAVSQLLKENAQLRAAIDILEEPKTGTPEVQTDEGLVQLLNDQKEESA